MKNRIFIFNGMRGARLEFVAPLAHDVYEMNAVGRESLNFFEFQPIEKRTESILAEETGPVLTTDVQGDKRLSREAGGIAVRLVYKL